MEIIAPYSSWLSPVKESAEKSEDCIEMHESLTGRYVAPEVFKEGGYDTKVDVFSFALILQEVDICSSLSVWLQET